MAEGNNDEKAASKVDQWRERITEQGRSGLTVKEFCNQRGLTECTFYAWRKRLRENGPVRFALVERGAARQNVGMDAQLELVLASGERLRIGSGVDRATLRTVLEALRA